jgi:hypothetical protein
MDIIPVFGTVVGGSNPSGGTIKRKKEEGKKEEKENRTALKPDFDLYSQ